MEKKHYLLLALLLAVPFIMFITLRENIVGTDSYMFLSHICNGTTLIDQPPLVSIIFSIIPCDFVAIKIILYILALASLLAIAKTAEIWHKNNAWLAGLFVFLSPILLFEFSQLENDQLAYPILFWANYFMLRGIKLQKKKPQIIGLFLIVATGLLLWNGAVYYLFPYAALTLFAFPFAAGALWIWGEKLANALRPNLLVYENLQGFGLIFLGGFLISVLGLFCDVVLAVPGIFWLLILWCNMKFGIHVVPFLSIATLNLYNHPNFKRFDKKCGKPIWESMKIALVAFAVVMLFVLGTSITYSQPPTAGQTEIVKKFVEMQSDCGTDCAKNDWSYGYWVEFYGGKATAYGGGIWEQDYNSGIILTMWDLNCTMLRQDREMKLMSCG